MWKHWVARTLVPYEPFSEFDTASWFWRRLKLIFPDMVFGVLMPNHFHLILPNEIQGTRKLGGLIAALSARLGVKPLWQPIPDPAKISDLHHLRRQIRYIALNPCRKKLCRDPLEWYWSSYRELMGAAASATADSNDTPISETLPILLREPAKHFRVRFHHYVSGDPSLNHPMDKSRGF